MVNTKQSPHHVQKIMSAPNLVNPPPILHFHPTPVDTRSPDANEATVAAANTLLLGCTVNYFAAKRLDGCRNAPITMKTQPSMPTQPTCTRMPL